MEVGKPAQRTGLGLDYHNADRIAGAACRGNCRGSPVRVGLVEKPNQFLASTWLLQLPYCLGLDLPNTFTRHFENMADFFQRVAVSIAQAISQLDDLAFPVTECLEDRIDTTSQHLLGGTGGRTFRATVW